MTKTIQLKAGDVVLITVPKTAGEPPTPEEPVRHPSYKLDVLLTINGVNIWANKEGTYCSFVSDLDICNDGCGPDYDDPHHQAQTAYYSGGVEGGQYLNADVDRYIVVPPQVRAMLPGIVMGCRGRVTNLKTMQSHEGVVGEIGPDDKTGETAYVLAKLLNPMIEHNSGDESDTYLYELWPDVPAQHGDFTYKLQPA